MAHDKNAGSVVIGKGRGGLLRRIAGSSIVDRLVQAATDVDVYVVAGTEDDRE